jgi:hypothetical protein
METWNLLISKRIRPKRLSFNKLILVGAEGFEPPTLCSQSRCATRLRYAPTLPLGPRRFFASRRPFTHGCFQFNPSRVYASAPARTRPRAAPNATIDEVHGGYSSAAERLTVAQDVVGSIPTSRPNGPRPAP